MASAVDRLIESDRLPDTLLRAGIRLNCAARLRSERRKGPAATDLIFERLRESPIAEQTELANMQHYELPPEFFQLVLGSRLKYSSCLWPSGVATLAEAEEAMLELTCARAGVEDGMELLDLGCGWGSLTGWLAERYPNARILAVSNSRLQHDFITAQRYANVDVLTADANLLTLDRRFDRILSVEMLEHMRNYEALFARIASWLAPEGRFFCHVFSHARYAYLYERGWMARRFFTAGTMPSHELLPRFQRDLTLEEEWKVGGEHYARTAEAWLDNMARNRSEIEEVLEDAYGMGRGRAWYANWRAFFLACAELWGYRDGSEWLVSHYRFAAK
ncbi:MAG TPA: cyclopropane-fatty-acyl-phospholipid synthase family protein [Gaiellaceae bacterium]|nr:cyclopropane-fatty-acyl-phospholipid synthase family protein [Gaiellaceae bacterium]